MEVKRPLEPLDCLHTTTYATLQGSLLEECGSLDDFCGWVSRALAIQASEKQRRCSLLAADTVGVKRPPPGQPAPSLNEIRV